MEEPWISTQQTVSSQVCVPVWRLKTEVLRYVMFLCDIRSFPTSEDCEVTRALFEHARPF